MNLIHDCWLPIRHANGKTNLIAPWQITENHDTNPIIAFNAPRPDFNGALMQFLIGLVQTTLAPNDNARDRGQPFDTPPTAKYLKTAFKTIDYAFELDGDEQRFMQDIDPLIKQEAKPITALLIDTAGSETHFIKHSQAGFCPTCAAMSLFTLQTNAPSGGVGHRTSLRGGGPLTTVLLYTPKPDRNLAASLWRSVWLNVLDKHNLENSDKTNKDIFPWLTETRVSDKGIDTTLDNIHPLQMFWGMPRRIRLDTENTTNGKCALCGIHSNQLMTHYRTKNYGVNYTGSWNHPLTPYSIDKKGKKLPIHPQSGGINYRHWLGLVQRTEKPARKPAEVIHQFNKKKFYELGRLRIWAYGYHLDNMKPICWYESTMPLYHLPTDEDNRKYFEEDIKRLIDSAAEMLKNLRDCLKKAWFKGPADVRGNTSFIDTAFWQDTEAFFFTQLEQLRQWYEPDDAEQQPTSILHPWHTYLRQYTLKQFEQWANYRQIGDAYDPKRIALARLDLIKFNYKKNIKEWLRLPKNSKKK